MTSLASNVAVGSVVLGSIYGLVGSGFVVLFRSTGVVSFAQGSFMVIGSLFFYTSVTNMGLGLYPALAITLIVLAGLGALTYRIAFARMADGDHLITSVATVGLGIVLQMAAYLIWGPNAKTYPSLLSFRRIEVGGVFAVTPVSIFGIVLAVVIIALTFVFLKYSRTGVKMRATADGQALAGYIGINVDRMAMIAWGLSALTAAAAGIAYTLGSQLDPVELPGLGLVVFPAIVLGGIDSIPGAIIGGLLLGTISSIVSTEISGDWSDPICYILLLVVLVIRPRGLFGSPQVARL